MFEIRRDQDAKQTMHAGKVVVKLRQIKSLARERVAHVGIIHSLAQWSDLPPQQKSVNEMKIS